jgi:hypothetical protein
MPGWEITAIAVGAAAMAALLAVLVTIHLFRKLAPQPVHQPWKYPGQPVDRFDQVDGLLGDRTTMRKFSRTEFAHATRTIESRATNK